MTERNAVYVAWQAPETRDWHVVGALLENSLGYEFHYTKGALKACNKDGFTPFSGMNDLNKYYLSKELFPLFKNRLLSNKRPEYSNFINWLSLSEHEATPLNILARSGGVRETDRLQLFQRMSVGIDGSFNHLFFLHGLSHLSDSAKMRVDSLEVDEKLFLCLDFQNPYDSNAVLARASDPAEIIGYCPRYLANDILLFLNHSTNLTVKVANISDSAPNSYRVLCRVSGKVETSLEEELNSQEEYQFTV